MGKDYKRITLYLSTKSDYEISLLKPSSDGFDFDDMLDKPSTSGSNQNDTDNLDKDYAFALALQKTLNEEEHEEKDDPGIEADVREKNESQIIYQDIAEVLKYLASQVVPDEQFYLVLRGGANLTRIIQL